MFLVESGATPTQIGLFHSITTSFQNLLQVLWGRIGDKKGRRIPFIVAGGLGYSIIWIPILYAVNPSLMLALLALQAVFYSMRLPNWTSLIGDMAPKDKRGLVTANVNFYATVAGLLAIISSGFIMYNIKGSLLETYSIPFFASTVFGILGTLTFLCINERKEERTDFAGSRNLSELLVEIKSNKDFMKYLVISFFSNTALVILLPIISIITIQIMKVDKLTFALYGVVRCLSLLVFQKRLGRITDLVGRKQLIILQRLAYVLIPGMFFLAPNKYYIFIPYALLGLLHAIESTANTSYLLDVTPSNDRGSFISLFNSIQGIGTFISTFISGFLIERFSQSMGLMSALQIMVIVTTLARIPTALAYTLLKEKNEYKRSLRDEVMGRLGK